MEKGYTLTEVVILFVIFLTVAILFIPLTIDDAINTKNIKKWQMVQSNFMSIAIETGRLSAEKEHSIPDKEDFINAIKENFPINDSVKYKIKYLNGKDADNMYNFEELHQTKHNAVIGYKWLNNNSKHGEDKIYGIIMYDVNGKKGPNTWGKDIFGMNVYANKIEPFGKREDPITVSSDCSKQGSGIFCSIYDLKEEH